MSSESLPDSLDIAGRARVAVQEPLERQMEPLGRPALMALAAKPGECILDIGCGAGQQTLELADAVGPSGRVLGIDISARLLDVARDRCAGRGAATFVEADAGTFPFAAGGYDAAFSRFGVMFFVDPVAAFLNIRRALKPDGRLAFVCWRAFDENELDYLPLNAAVPHLPLPPPPDSGAPGPFAFAEADRLRSILAAAGFEEVAVAPHDQRVGSDGLEATLEVLLQVGALGRIIRENPQWREAVVEPVRAALAMRNGPDGVKLNAATWIVTARCKPENP